jgi:hypothetical protein
MKNGILIYKSYANSFNIGDYIQSLAAKQFIKEPIELINREELDCYEGDPIKLILNGWFLHEIDHWPPSNLINPLFISIHLNSDAYKILKNNNAIEYFNKYNPIGCRDKVTMSLLKEKGVNAYFSGCLSLTLGESYKCNERTDLIYFVDPYFEIKKDIFSILVYIFLLLSKIKEIKKLSTAMFKSLKLKALIKTASFYNSYERIFDVNVLEKAIYINHVLSDSNFNCEENKFDYAKCLINKYATAKFVVTSRIHCALPCIGLETPVLFVDNINQPLTSYCRLDGIRELFHVIKYNKGKLDLPLKHFEIKKIDLQTTFANKLDYLKLKEKLISNCHDFFI